MKYRIWFATAVFLVASATALYSQDLAEAAKKERERRAAFKNKAVPVLTSDMVSRLKKKPAISVTSEAIPPAGPEAGTLPAESEPADKETAPPRNVPSTTVIQPTVMAGAGEANSAGGQASDAESRWQKAKEYADLLELKLNSLWLRFYSLDDGMPRELLQQEIAEVFEKYTRAREEEQRLGEGIAPRKDEDR